jgi:hypothetical protein
MSLKKQKITSLINVIICCLAITHFSHAQHFTHKSDLETITQKAYYQIHVPNKIRALAEPDLKDLRILDEQNKQVPYKVKYTDYKVDETNFEDYNFTQIKNDFIINKGSKTVSNYLVLKLKNTAITKYYTLSGSNNQKDWFALTDTSSFTVNSNSNTNVYWPIYFPVNDYQFIKLSINDAISAPINIESIGYYKNQSVINELDKIEEYYQSLSGIEGKTTSIKLTIPNKQQIDEIRFKVNGPTYYNRNVTIFKKAMVKQKRQLVPHKEVICQLTLNSKNSLNFPVNIYENELFIDIENNDNQPLAIDSIQLYQKPIYLIAELNTNQKYAIYVGDKSLNAPIYDIENFNELDNKALPEIKIQSIQNLTIATKTLDKTKAFYEQSWFMWTCIGIGILVLALFSASLLKEVK